MSRYLEKEAIYRVEIPDDWDFSNELQQSHFTEKEVRNYYRDKLVKMTVNGYVEKDFIQVYLLKEDFSPHRTDTIVKPVGFWRAWVGVLVQHCPQVEQYIKDQQKLEYTSPFDGKTK